MTVSDDERFWNRAAEKYSTTKVGDQAAYQQTLYKTRSFLNDSDSVLELGCGTGSTALILAPCVRRYTATDLSPKMIDIALKKLAMEPSLTGLEFSATTADALSREASRYNAVLGFNYLHLVRDPSTTLQSIHTLLSDGGLFINKTPCLGEMNPLLRWVALPVMHAFGLAPYAGSFTTAELKRLIANAGFEVVVDEIHCSKGNDKRPYIVARKL